jgi:hypothetical protein
MIAPVTALFAGLYLDHIADWSNASTIHKIRRAASCRC